MTIIQSLTVLSVYIDIFFNRLSLFLKVCIYLFPLSLTWIFSESKLWIIVIVEWDSSWERNYILFRNCPEIVQIRCKLEQSAVPWHFGLSDKNRVKLERVQKSALKVILGKRYITYSDALKKLNIQSLEERRKSLCLKFAKKCLQVEKLKKLFPKNLKKHTMFKRGSDKFKVNRSLTQRYQNSAIPQMQRMLNLHEKQRQKIMKEISFPVNFGFCKSLSLR